MAAGVYLIYTNWQQLLEFVEGGLNGWVNVLNKVIDALNVVNRFLGADEAHMNTHFEGFSFATRRRENANAQEVLGPGGGVLLAQPGMAMAGGAVGPRAPMAPSWLMQGTGFGNGGMTGATTSYGPVTFSGDINIKSTDPKGAARELQRTIRAGQTRKKL
jgi:hypothetical protein